jgi:hypothetical protein
MAKKTSRPLLEAASAQIKKGFSLEAFKEKKLLTGNVKFKEQTWISFSPAMQDVLSLPGIPVGHITIIRGKSNTGKTTLSIEAAVQAQKMGILPVIIITEMKHDWNHWRTMGFQMEDVVDEETGEITDHKGFFIYRDRSTLNCIEDIAEFMADLMHEQKKGNLPYDLLFLWDSVGSIPCQMSLEQGKNNAMWNAGAMATQFGNFINQQITLTRKETSTYTNTFLVVNKVGVAPPDSPRSKPKMTNKGGDTMYYDASICLTFGNITNAGTMKIEAVRGKKRIEFALKTKIACDKNHINGITSKGTIVSTVHGYIKDDANAINKYKKEYSGEWITALGGGDFTLTEDSSEWDESDNITPLLEESFED